MHPLFLSNEHGGSFETCCSCALPFGATPYLVSKIFRGDECIVEYAICMDCQANLCKEFSEESKKSLQRFLSSDIDMEKLFARNASEPGPESWLQACSSCGKPRSEMTGHSIGARFQQEELLYDPPPICLCEPCEEAYDDCISEKTRDIRDDFFKNHIAPDPFASRPHPSGTPKPMLV